MLLKIFRVFLCLLTITLSLELRAQSLQKNSFYDYKPARCAGEIPSDFLVKSSEKAEAAKREIKDSRVSRQDKKQEFEYAITSSFAVDEMLSSGQILFGDSMSLFIQNVAKRILESNGEEELLKKLRFYVLKSPIPNAYCTSNGAVLVSVGLLSRLENEAQLAFILSHEIQHYILKHSLKEYKKINTMKNASSGQRLEDKLSDIYNFSQENENEADLNGFKMMQRAGYNLDEGVYVFDMLKYAEYPFLEITLPIDSFETEYYKFPLSLHTQIKEAVKKGADGDEKHLQEQGDETNKTHPSLDRRINRMRDMIAADGNQKGKPLYLAGKESFNYISKMARHELLLLYLRYADYGNAYYLAEVMQKLYGSSLFIAKVKAMSIYGLAHHSSLKHSMDKYGCNVSRSRGEWRPLIALFSKMDLKELSAFGSRQIYFIKKEYKDDPFLDKVSRDFFRIVQSNALIRISDLALAKPQLENNQDTIEKSDETDNNSGIKNPRNRVKRNASTGASMGTYYMQIFTDIKDREYLQKFLKEMQYSELSKTEGEKQDPIAKKSKPEQVVTQMVMFPPQIELSYGSENKRDLYQEEDYKEFLVNKWDELGDKANLNIDVLRTNMDQRVSLEAINDYMALSDWIIERLNNDTQDMVLFNGEFVKEPMQRKNATHVGWVSYDYKQGKRKFSPEYMLYSMVFYPTFPLYLIWQFSRDYQFNEYCVVFNTQTGKAIHVKRKKFSSRLQGDLLNAQIYETLYNVKYGK
jgi:hypothetical protein